MELTSTPSQVRLFKSLFRVQQLVASIMQYLNNMRWYDFKYLSLLSPSLLQLLIVLSDIIFYFLYSKFSVSQVRPHRKAVAWEKRMSSSGGHLVYSFPLPHTLKRTWVCRHRETSTSRHFAPSSSHTSLGCCHTSHGYGTLF